MEEGRSGGGSVVPVRDFAQAAGNQLCRLGLGIAFDVGKRRLKQFCGERFEIIGRASAVRFSNNAQHVDAACLWIDFGGD